MYQVVRLSQQLTLLFVLLTLHYSCATTSDEFGVGNATRYYEYEYNVHYGKNITHEVQNPHRIVGGSRISIRKAPWQIALINRNSFICGGSIISRNWVLTAAHCVTGPGPYMIRAGTRYFKSGGVTRRVVKIVSNTGYNPRTSQSDIAMLRLIRPLVFSSRLRPVRLAGRRSKLPNNYYVSGWGAIGERSTKVIRDLRRVRVAFVTKSKCLRAYRGNAIVPRQALCSASPGKDSCYGDSGGPLVHRNVQFGVVSFGIGCARRRYPGVYTDVRRYRSWIKRVAQRYN